MVCRNICIRFKATKDRRSSYYVQGCKRCQTCEIFIKWRGTRCPCCQRPLRTKPHNRKGKHKEKGRINYINHDINSSFEKITPNDEKAASFTAAKKTSDAL